MDIVLIAILTFFSAGIGTLTGFGTSTIMVPVLLLVYPLPETLLLAGIVHWFTNIWKIALFRSAINWRLILLFGIPGLVCTWIAASLMFSIDESPLTLILGIVLVLYVIFMYFHQSYRLPANGAVATLGGSLSGFMAGIFGIGGPVQSVFLSAFDLPKAVYISTIGAIGLFIDSGRIIRYITGGAMLESLPLWSLLIFIFVSFIGAMVAKRIVNHIPQESFRLVVLAFLFVVGVRYIFWA